VKRNNVRTATKETKPKKPKKSMPRPAKRRAMPKPLPSRKEEGRRQEAKPKRTRTAKVVRQKVVWVVFDNSNKKIQTSLQPAQRRRRSGGQVGVGEEIDLLRPAGEGEHGRIGSASGGREPLLDRANRGLTPPLAVTGAHAPRSPGLKRPHFDSTTFFFCINSRSSSPCD